MNRIKDILDRIGALETELSALRTELRRIERRENAPAGQSRFYATKEIEETTDSGKAAELIATGAWVILGHYFSEHGLMWILGRIADAAVTKDRR